MTKQPAKKQPSARRQHAERLGRLAEAKSAMLAIMHSQNVSDKYLKTVI